MWNSYKCNFKKWYKGFIEAAKSNKPQQSFADFIGSPEGIMPETIITDIYKDLLEEHPLLTKINFVNAKYLTKWILNDHTIDTAVWGPLNSKITKELTSAFKAVDITQNKLSAFVFPPNFLALNFRNIGSNDIKHAQVYIIKIIYINLVPRINCHIDCW